MFSSTSSSARARPPAVEVPDIVATDDDEGDTGANTLLAEEAIRTLGGSQANTPTQTQQPSLLDSSISDTVLAMPDSYSEADCTSPDQGVDSQPLLSWQQSSSQAQRLQRQRSGQHLPPLRSPPPPHRSMSQTADLGSSNQIAAHSEAAPQAFYGVEPRRPVRRQSSSQLLTNMPGRMRRPYRQQSLLSRGSPPVTDTGRRWVSHDHETAHSAHAHEMIEMTGNSLSRITSEARESSSGSVLVEVSPDSYEPLQSAMPGMVNQLPIMLEEEAEVCTTGVHTRTCIQIEPLHAHGPIRHTAQSHTSMDNATCTVQ